MCKKLTDEQIEFAKDKFNEVGVTYYDVCRELDSKYGVVINPESLRYHITRKDKPKVTIKDKLKEDGIEKVLVISDIHIPFNRDDIIDIVIKHKDEISTLILGGDIVDCHAISSFDPLDALPLIEEMAATHKILKEIQNIIPDVRKIMIKGNHEVRFEKYLAKNENELNKLHSANILDEIVKGFVDYDRPHGKITTYEPLSYEVIDNWWMLYNGLVVCHPTSFSRVAAKTSQTALDYFVEQGIDFDTCLVAHTHKVSSCFKYGKYAVEIGCMCKPQSYASSGKLSYTQQQCGYHLAVFKDGQYDVNESKQYVLQEE